MKYKFFLPLTTFLILGISMAALAQQIGSDQPDPYFSLARNLQRLNAAINTTGQTLSQLDTKLTQAWPQTSSVNFGPTHPWEPNYEIQYSLRASCSSTTQNCVFQIQTSQELATFRMNRTERKTFTFVSRNAIRIISPDSAPSILVYSISAIPPQQQLNAWREQTLIHISIIETITENYRFVSDLVLNSTWDNTQIQNVISTIQNMLNSLPVNSSNTLDLRNQIQSINQQLQAADSQAQQNNLLVQQKTNLTQLIQQQMLILNVVHQRLGYLRAMFSAEQWQSWDQLQNQITTIRSTNGQLR